MRKRPSPRSRFEPLEREPEPPLSGGRALPWWADRPGGLCGHEGGEPEGDCDGCWPDTRDRYIARVLKAERARIGKPSPSRRELLERIEGALRYGRKGLAYSALEECYRFVKGGGR